MTARRRDAFTLIEMLLVVAIIVLLIALLLPTLGEGKERAKELYCQSNMSQIGRVTLAYAADNAGKFPANRFTPDKSKPAEHVTWRWLLHKASYADETSIWECPEDPQPNRSLMTEEGRSIHGSRCIGDVEANYAYNGSVLWRWSPIGAPDGSDDSRYGLPNPRAELTGKSLRGLDDSTMMVIESRYYWPDIGDWWIGGSLGDGKGPFSYWHRGGGNWAMADGSVRWAKMYDTFSPDCWWHLIDEPVDPHVDWAGRMLPEYK